MPESTFWDAAQGIGTLGAFAWGFVLFRSQQKDRRREQAARVSATRGDADDSPGKICVDVTNHSDQPIYDVYPIVAGFVGDRCHHADVLGGDETKGLVVKDVHLPFDADRRVGVQFMDSRGRSWDRLPDGRLIDRTWFVKVSNWNGAQPEGSRRRRIGSKLTILLGERLQRRYKRR